MRSKKILIWVYVWIKKIDFFGRFITEKSVFGRHREEKAEEKLGKNW